MMENRDVIWVCENSQAKLERSNKRMFILALVLIIVLFASNGAWVYYESQFKTETTTTTTIKAEQESDGDSENYIIGGDYHASEAEGNDNKENH